MYGQLPAEAPVDQHAEFHFIGPAKVQQGVHGCAGGSAGEQNIVDQHHVFVFDGKGDICLVGDVQFIAYVVAVKGDIQDPVLQVGAGKDGPDLPGDAVAQPDPPRLDADDTGIAEVAVVFDDLVCQPFYGDGQLPAAENRLQWWKFPLK